MFPFHVTQRWIIVFTNLARTTERVTMALITIPVPAVDISKDKTVKVLFKYCFLFVYLFVFCSLYPFLSFVSNYGYDVPLCFILNRFNLGNNLKCS